MDGFAWPLWQTQVHAPALKPSLRALASSPSPFWILRSLFSTLIALCNSKLYVTYVCSLCLPESIINSLRTGATFLWPSVQPGWQKQDDFLNFHEFLLYSQAYQPADKIVPGWNKDDFRGAVTPCRNRVCRFVSFGGWGYFYSTQQWYLLLIRSHRGTVGFEEKHSPLQSKWWNCNFKCNVWSLSHSNGDRSDIWEGS